MNRRLHLALALLVASVLEMLAVRLIDALVPGDLLAVGLCILAGVVAGVCVVAYWEEVIDRARS